MIVSRRGSSVAVQVAAAGLLAAVLLYRDTGLPSWITLYAEDRGVFLVHALARPWDLLVPYQGYLQLPSRLVAQLVALLPLTWAAAAFAWAGALIAGGCALFVFHASSGYIRSRALRAVLAVALILLPVAPLELAANTVNAPWYLMTALFWAALWRPERRAGKAASALIAFASVTSSPLAVVFAPLLAARVLARRPARGRRFRDHWVTAGWLLGWPFQLYVIALSYAAGTERADAPGTLPGASGYWARTVVLRAFGWHGSWDLVHRFGTAGATALSGAGLAVLLGLAALWGGRRTRLLIPLGLATGFVFTVGAAMITGYVVREAPAEYPVAFEAASRYSALPLILIDAMLIAGADGILRRQGGLRPALASAVRGPARRAAAGLGALAVLAAVLVPGWVSDYGYRTQRTTGGPWRPVARHYLHLCRDRSSVRLPEWNGRGGQYHVIVPCTRLKR